MSHAAGEPPPRYMLPGGIAGAASLPEYARLLAGGALWIGAVPLAARLLARAGRRRTLHVIERWWGRGVLRHLHTRLDIAGVEQIDRRERYVVVSLHEGFADVPALLHLPLDLRFVARDELFGWRVLGPYLHDTGQIEIAPERGCWSYRRLLREAQAVFEAGEHLVIFAQGTILGIESDFHGGAFALARALRRPILPVALTGSHRVWEHPYTPRVRYDERISLRVFQAISVAELLSTGLDELRVSVRRRLKAAALDGTMAAPRHFIPARDGYWDGYVYRIDPDFPQLAAHIARHRQEQAA